MLARSYVFTIEALVSSGRFGCANTLLRAAEALQSVPLEADLERRIYAGFVPGTFAHEIEDVILEQLKDSAATSNIEREQKEAAP